MKRNTTNRAAPCSVHAQSTNGELTALQRVDVLRRAGRAIDAIAFLRTAIAREPNDYRLHDELGEALCHVDRIEEGIGAFLAALRIKPDYEEACYKIGVAFASRRMYEMAIDWFERAMKINPAAARNLAPWAKALLMVGNYTAAAEVLQKWADAEPHHPAPRHALHAVLGSTDIARASPEYVRDLFDRYAPEFDGHVAKLKYRAPQALVSNLLEVASVPEAGWDILDVGCGTGLAGVQLRRFARRLVGVDLSPRMLEAARRRETYDELVEGDLIDGLRARPRSFDLIAAADVLPYFGDLSEFFRCSQGALRDDGLLIFVVEALADDTYRLNPTGRFSHSASYLHAALQEAGFEVVRFREEVCRHERDEPVPAYVVVGSTAKLNKRYIPNS